MIAATTVVVEGSTSLLPMSRAQSDPGYAEKVTPKKWRAEHLNATATAETVPVDPDARVAAVASFIHATRKHAAPLCVARKWPDWYDRRLEARVVFKLFMDEFELCVATFVNGHADCFTDDLFVFSVASTDFRVPIACNTGPAGCGKTTQLQLLCQDFVSGEGLFDQPGEARIAVYFTLGGEDGSHQGLDHDLFPRDRLVRRILHGLISRGCSLETFLQRFAQFEVAQRSKDDAIGDDEAFRQWLFESLPEIIRRVCDADASTPILIAADDLRKWGLEPQVGKPSRAAVTNLLDLASLSQSAARRTAGARALAAAGRTMPSNIPGPVFIAASTSAVVDPAKAAETSKRPVFYMPLPPLNPCVHDETLAEATTGKDPRIFCILRAALFVARDNARKLKELETEAKEKGATLETAVRFHADVVDRCSMAAEGVSLMLQSKPLSERDYRHLLESLFQRTAYIRTSLRFNGRLVLTRLCDSASGVATILRDGRTDTGFMSPRAIRQILCTPKTAGVHPEEKMLLSGFCDKMLELPAAVGTPRASKLYAQLIVQAFAMRVNTLPPAGMSLYEFVKGVPPPWGEDRTSFFATTTVHGWDAPLKEAPDFVFPRAARLCSNLRELHALVASTRRKFAKPLKLSGKTISANHSIWSNCEFQHAPGASPFYAIFAHDYNVLLDGCICLRVTFGNDFTWRHILLGLQATEHARPDRWILDEHQTNIASLARWHRQNKALEDWLKNETISEVVTVYVGPNALPGLADEELPGANGLHQLRDGQTNGIYDRFKHRCYVHDDDIRRWCPSVAYSACDACVPEKTARQ